MYIRCLRGLKPRFEKEIVGMVSLCFSIKMGEKIARPATLDGDDTYKGDDDK
jgi:hypothetical protein